MIPNDEPPLRAAIEFPYQFTGFRVNGVEMTVVRIEKDAAFVCDGSEPNWTVCIETPEFFTSARAECSDGVVETRRNENARSHDDWFSLEIELEFGLFNWPRRRRWRELAGPLQMQVLGQCIGTSGGHVQRRIATWASRQRGSSSMPQGRLGQLYRLVYSYGATVLERNTDEMTHTLLETGFKPFDALLAQPHPVCHFFVDHAHC